MRRLARVSHRSRHRATARHVHPQREHVHKVADQRLGARRVAPVVRRADHHLLLPGVPAQQHRPHAHHQLEERAPAGRPAETLEARHRDGGAEGAEGGPLGECCPGDLQACYSAEPSEPGQVSERSRRIMTAPPAGSRGTDWRPRRSRAV